MPQCRAGETTGGHCCWINGQVCPFLRDDGPPQAIRWIDSTPYPRPHATRRYVCTLREELGSWEAVHQDARYLTFVAASVHSVVGVNCGDWPPPGETCVECGALDPIE